MILMIKMRLVQWEGAQCDKGSISGHRHSRDIQRMHSFTKLTTTIYYLQLFTIRSSAVTGHRLLLNMFSSLNGEKLEILTSE